MKIKDKNLIKQIVRYIYISILGYGFVFSSLFLLVDVLKQDESLSFILVYGVLYLSLYFIQLKFLFNTKHQKSKLIKFILFLFVFYILSNILFNLFLYAEIHYLVATIITIGILTPLRFLTSKYYVYK